MTLLEKLSAAQAPSGCEESVCEIIREELSALEGEITSDALGSLIYHKKGAGKRLMLIAAVDEPGFMVTDIDEAGFLHCHFFGGAEGSSFAFGEVELTSGCRGVMQSADGRKTDRRDLFIDIGAKSRAEAEKKVRIGAAGAFSCTPRVSGNGCITGKALSTRAGAAALVSALGRIKTDGELYAVFAARHFDSCRGAKAAAGAIKPDEVLAVGFADADDVPGGEGKISLGAGPLISVGERDFVASKIVRDKLASAGEGLSLSVTGEVNSEAAAAGEYGAFAGALLIPVRYRKTAAEKVCLSDVEAAADIIVKYVNENE